MYFTFMSNSCKEILPQWYICDKQELKEIEDGPCEIQLLGARNISKCLQTQVYLTQPLLNQLDTSN